ncbi:LysR family transcriptional regulator [Agrobacterium sp. TS43]|uniref:LysR family transcriptional regulator n=1 Tax=Agrobacterium TaxID=357 RepID=UPI0003716598|nr:MULTISPECIES: LysR family transcriptional regulator [Agrobacterium]EPR07856.1 LysR family transcriptional regulator [Agrobacterium radiobacter DSM 30147]KDR87190.1 LysR family transcriptional regulator [Agrobacterium tumefaciens GW4]KVK40715.1 LysR family transcriptional regulator [Agrobacterium sp. JL28]KVK40910.1 LysR family transcriptional regulator [Agrobacterium sp. LY4]KVK55323.1 LysR family transcriptional regulator [Agrobacterium sp. TS45]
MNIKQLEVLRTLLSTGSTIATAKAMGLSQSGISRLLAQLEADLSLTLFARDKGRLIPTPEAVLLARDAENVLLAVDRMSGHAEDLRNGAAGPEIVRIGLPSSMWENFAPAMLIDYVRDFPGVRIETFFETTTAINKLVGERVIDLGFLRMEGEIGPGIDVERVATGKSVCVVREDHPLAELDEITVKDLRNVPLILIGRQRPNRMALDQVFKKAGVKPMVKIETHTNSSACAYVAHGLGVTIISSFYANLYRHLPVVPRPFVPQATQEFGLARASGAPLSIAAQALSDALKREIQLSQKID